MRAEKFFPGTRPVLISLIAGLTHAVSLAAPWDGQPIWWLQLVSLSALVALLARHSTLSQGVFLAWLFATTWLAATFWWLFISMHVYAGLPVALAILAVLCLAAVLAIYYAIAAGLFLVLAPGGPAIRTLCFAASWMLAELARGSWFTGFPWGASGYAQLDGPLIGYAPWVGVYGLCGLSAWICMGMQQLKTSSHTFRLAMVVVLTLPALHSHYGDGYSSTSQSISVELLQGNIAQDEKFQPGSGVPQALRWYAEQLGLSKAQLIIAPETAIPLLPAQMPPGYWEALALRFSSGEQAAMVGMPMGNFADGYTNSVLGFKPGQTEAWRYDKHHLVPFGEFIPPLFKWFTELMNIPLGDFNRGSLGQPSFEWLGQKLAANVCYEDLFGEELAARFSDPKSSPTIFVNTSNIAWFGNTLAIDQHLHISRMRAIEFERPFVRATNTGATAVIDHHGRVTSELPRLTQGVLTAQVEGRTGLTPYAYWVSRLGLWPLWIVACLTLIHAWRASVKRQ